MSEQASLRRYLLTDGALGALPEWYPLVRAARYLRVAPWELAEQPLTWMQWALVAEAAELEAREARARQVG